MPHTRPARARSRGGSVLSCRARQTPAQQRQGLLLRPPSRLHGLVYSIPSELLSAGISGLFGSERRCRRLRCEACGCNRETERSFWVSCQVLNAPLERMSEGEHIPLFHQARSSR